MSDENLACRAPGGRDGAGDCSSKADHAPTSEERTRIEAKRKELGFSSWEEIELEDNDTVWEVSDAIGSDGAEYEIRLDPNTLQEKSCVRD
ncbi:PepSY domain-containing protein [Rhodoligotrophos ferricapiens]|uniref:PepSY domain-containing protein n=1 Tax=Rhodoligotrophos ferricapiens TaxID=3069264 RepID=UPI00315DC30F